MIPALSSPPPTPPLRAEHSHRCLVNAWLLTDWPIVTSSEDPRVCHLSASLNAEASTSCHVP